MATRKSTAAAVEPLNLRQKLAAVAKSLGDVKPEGYNSFHKYKYYSDEQLSGMFRQRFAEHGIILVPDVMHFDIQPFTTEKGKHSWLTTLRVKWTLKDAGSDEEIVAYTVGQGDDPGDKGANKAMTGAFKYLLIKMFQIGGEESDAEADTSTDERHSKPAKAKVQKAEKPVEDVQKGGRQKKASETQVDVVSRLAGQLGIGMSGLVNVIRNTLSVDVELPENEVDQAKFMRSFMENLDAAEIGKVVGALQEALERKP